MDDNEKKLRKWEKISSKMYAGWVISVSYKGEVYFIDQEYRREVSEMEGTKIVPIIL